MWWKLADVEMTLKHFFATTVKLKLKTDIIIIDSGFTAGKHLCQKDSV